MSLLSIINSSLYSFGNMDKLMKYGAHWVNFKMALPVQLNTMNFIH